MWTELEGRSANPFVYIRFPLFFKFDTFLPYVKFQVLGLSHVGIMQVLVGIPISNA